MSDVITYKIVEAQRLDGGVYTYIQRSDGAAIPQDEENIDYQEYLKWVSEQPKAGK